MSRKLACSLAAILVAVVTIPSVAAAPAAPSADAAWKTLPAYQPGQDMAALLVIDQEVIRAMATPQARAACAARLAAILESPDATAAARQYACLQLRQVGTPAQVPALAKMLAQPANSQIARYALEAIPGEESLAALRSALPTLHGDLLIGVINSVAARRDGKSAAKLIELAHGDEGTVPISVAGGHKNGTVPLSPVAAAASWALGNIGGDEATAFLIQQAEKAGVPTPARLAVPLLRCAEKSAAGGGQRAAKIYAMLSQAKQPAGIRRAALEGQLGLQGNRRDAMILAWFSGGDAEKRLIAAARLDALPAKELADLTARWATLPESSQLILLSFLTRRKDKQALPMLLAAAGSEKPEVKLATIRSLGMLGDAASLGFLMARLEEGGPVAAAAQEALGRLPRKAVCDALLSALTERPKARLPAMAALGKLKCYEAIDPLIALVATQQTAVSEAAVESLKEIADPDDTDIPRLLALYARLPQGNLRDSVERAVAIVCSRAPAKKDRAEPVLKVVAKLPPKDQATYLPLLGRLGGAQVRAMIDAALASPDPAVKQSAMQGLCHWPNAEMADRLWQMATEADDRTAAPSPLRAYVRVITLKSDRPASETLAMLQKAMPLARALESKQWILQRASTVRTLEAAQWIAGYLDDPELAQTACRSLVELAHQRFLRHPNMATFGPLLEKVSKVSKDPGVVERAKKYRLGL